MLLYVLLIVIVLTPPIALMVLRRRRGQAQGTLRSAGHERLDARRLSYRYADDDVFIQGGGIYTGVLMPASAAEFRTSSEMGDTAMRPISIYATLLSLFDNKPVHCQELIRYRPVTAHGWREQLLRAAWNPSELFKGLTLRLAEHIKESTPQRMWVLIVRLGDFPRGPVTDPLAKMIGNVTGVQEERIDREALEKYRFQARRIHDVLATQGVQPISRRDLLWLIRKPTYGHLPVPEMPTMPVRPWRDGFFEIAATLRGHNPGWHIELKKPDADTDEPRTSFTATLVVIDQQPRAVFTSRSAWGPRLARLERPVDITWAFQLIPAAMNEARLAKAVSNVLDEHTDRVKANAPLDPKFELRVTEAKQYRNENAESAEPGMIGRLRLTVSAETAEDLAAQIRAVKQAMGDVTVERPENGQLQLLEEQLPGGEGLLSQAGALSAGPAGGLALWERHTDLYQPAIAHLGAYSQVGDRIRVERGRELGWIGIPIAYVKSNGQVVHFDPIAQIARGDGAGIALLGKSGSGKTNLALLIMFWASEAGTRCIVLDPKVDFRNFIFYIAFGPQVLHPEFLRDADAGVLGTPKSQFQPVNRAFWDDTEIFDLAAGERGILDCWRITDTFEEGYHLAQEITDVLFGEPEHRTLVKAALREIHKQQQSDPALRVGYADIIPCLTAAREEVHQDLERTRQSGGPLSSLRAEVAHYDQVITRLESAMTTPFARLAMGKGTDRHRPMTMGRRRMIFTMAGYRSPDNPDAPETWSESDRNASAAMRLVMRQWRSTLKGRLVANPVTGTPGIPPSCKFIDEFYMVTPERAQRAAVNIDLRQGRSLASAIVILDQQPRGINAIEADNKASNTEESNQFGTVFGFMQRSGTEARELLSLIRPAADLDNNDQNTLAKRLTPQENGGELRQGECAMRDGDGDAVVVVDMVFDTLQRAAQTNHQLIAQDWTHPVPTSPQDWSMNSNTLRSLRTSIAARTEQDYPDIADLEADTDDDELLAAAFADSEAL